MFLGVDGGGTQTTFTLINHQAQVLAQYQTSGCYYIAIGLQGAAALLNEGIDAICQRAGIGSEAIQFAFFGLPAYGESSHDLEQLNNLPSGRLRPEQYCCDNDMVNGWAAGLGGQDSINIVAGTGSIAYGERQGRGARSGGWSELFGDEGSAYWIGREALGLYAKMADGRLDKTVLYALIKQRLQLEIDLDLVDLVHNRWQGNRSEIAGICRLVDEAYDLGDPYAQALFEGAAHELAIMVQSVAGQLEFNSGEPIQVTYSGGVFNAGDVIIKPLKNQLAQLNPNYRLLQPCYSPGVGAALYAAMKHGCTFTADALDKL